jgi:hypothetical protein
MWYLYKLWEIVLKYSNIKRLWAEWKQERRKKFGNVDYMETLGKNLRWSVYGLDIADNFVFVHVD